MEKLLELDDITLLPSVANNGMIGTKMNFMVSDEKDLGGIPGFLPIFTSPLESIVGENSSKLWTDYGIRPIIPRTEHLSSRLKYCPWIFSSFSLSEIQKEFIDKDKRSLGTSLHVYIDYGNGHSTNLLNICYKLKQLYSTQIIIMCGNVGNVETYALYGKAGIDYMRVGLSSDTMIEKREFGFHYPMASLLIDLSNYKKTGGIGLPEVKIVADCEISGYSDIMKAIALGADYVMVGREFSRIVEAEGTMYTRSKNQNTGEMEFTEIQEQERYYGTSGYHAKLNGLCRSYHGNTKKKDTSLWSWVDIDISLQEWTEGFRDCMTYGFTMSGSKNWSEFKKNIRFGRI